MNHLRKFIFFAFIASTLAITAFAFWYFSLNPSEKQIAKAFPANSFQFFNESKSLTLYALNSEGKAGDAEDFRGFPVAAKTAINDQRFQILLKRSLLKALVGGESESCFNPRHGLRISDGKQKTLDFVISFECGNFVSYFDDKKGEGEISRSAELLFNQTLKNTEKVKN